MSDDESVDLNCLALTPRPEADCAQAQDKFRNRTRFRHADAIFPLTILTLTILPLAILTLAILPYEQSTCKQESTHQPFHSVFHFSDLSH